MRIFLKFRKTTFFLGFSVRTPGRHENPGPGVNNLLSSVLISALICKRLKDSDVFLVCSDKCPKPFFFQFNRRDHRNVGEENKKQLSFHGHSRCTRPFVFERRGAYSFLAFSPLAWIFRVVSFQYFCPHQTKRSGQSNERPNLYQLLGAHAARTQREHLPYWRRASNAGIMM